MSDSKTGLVKEKNKVISDCVESRYNYSSGSDTSIWPYGATDSVGVKIIADAEDESISLAEFNYRHLDSLTIY